MDKIPDWAYERVSVLFNGFAGYRTPFSIQDHYNDMKGAFAQYIAQHEDPPADPLIKLLIETDRALNEAKVGTLEDWYAIFAQELRNRGVSYE